MISAARSHLLNILTNAPIGIITTTLDWRIDLANPAAARMHGYANNADDQGASMLPLLGDAPEVQVKLYRLRNETVDRVELAYTLAPSEDGADPVYVEATVTLLRDDNYVPIGGLFMCSDVTEKRLLAARLHEAEQLSLAGKIAVTLQHEINNPLQSITGNTEILLQGVNDDPADQIRLRQILDDAQRIARQVNRLRRLTRLKTVSYVEGIDMIDVTSPDCVGEETG